MNIHSPLQIPLEVLQLLKSHPPYTEQVDCFIKPKYTSFCTLHRRLSRSARESFTTQLSFIQLLLTPLTTLHDHSSTLAHLHLTHNPRRKSSSPSSSPQLLQPPLLTLDLNLDLELAFRGPSRAAFSWLSAFFASEPSWSRPSSGNGNGNACPACLTLQTFSAEPYLRILVAASRLRTLLQDSQMIGNGNAKPQPPLDDRLLTPILQAAITEDSFWGPLYWEKISSRADVLETGIKQLVLQCQQLQDRYPTTTTTTTPPREMGPASMPAVTFAPRAIAVDLFARSGETNTERRGATGGGGGGEESQFGPGGGVVENAVILPVLCAATS